MVKTYIRPSDPTSWPGQPPYTNANGLGGSNYAANIWVFWPLPSALTAPVFQGAGNENNYRAAPPYYFPGTDCPSSLYNSMPDGLSTTVILAQRDRNCADAGHVEEGPAWRFVPGVFPGRDRDLSAFGCYMATNSTLTCPDYNQNNSPFEISPNPFTACVVAETQSGHPGAMNIVMGDASVRGVTSGISNKTWEIACYPADGQVVGADRRSTFRPDSAGSLHDLFLRPGGFSREAAALTHARTPPARGAGNTPRRAAPARPAVPPSCVRRSLAHAYRHCRQRPLQRCIQRERDLVRRQRHGDAPVCRRLCVMPITVLLYTKPMRCRLLTRPKCLISTAG